MTYLVDANILSEPTKHRPDAKVITLAYGLTVATHNVRDFQKAGVPVIDRFV